MGEEPLVPLERRWGEVLILEDERRRGRRRWRGAVLVLRDEKRGDGS